MGTTAAEKVCFVEESWEADISDKKFSAYLSLHEFEALLFSKPQEIADGFAHPELAGKLQNIRNGFRSPEEINDHPDTAPSARLQQMYPRYSKTFFGALIAGRIGIDQMCAECEHFAEWVIWLKTL